MKVPGHKVGNWLDSETPLTSSTPTSHCLLSPAWWIPKCTPASFPHFHPLPSALNEALVIFYLEYGNPPLFCLPPSLSSFPSSVLTLIQAGPSTWQNHQWLQCRRSQFKTPCRPYKTFWAPSLTKPHIDSSLHFPKYLISFFSLSLLLPLHETSFPSYPVESA